MPVTNINHVVLTGRLTSDPDLRVLPSGTSVCHLRVAVNGRRRDCTGEWAEKANFFDVLVFGAPGESVAKYMYKGRPVAIDGRLNWRAWETREGRKAQGVNIIAKRVQFLGTPPSDGNGLAGESNGMLRGIEGGDEEPLDLEDQEAIAAVAAAG
jgi:single-strand DNA-binding protein